MLYYGSRTTVARFVSDLLIFLKIDLQSIMITRLVKSEAYCVSIAIGSSSEDIVKEMVERTSYGAHLSTSPPNTPGG